MKPSKAVALASASLLLFAGPGSLYAQDHGGHHLQNAPAASGPAQQPTSPAGKAPALGDGMNMGGMMGPDHMGKMMKMVQEMHSKMMSGMSMQPRGDKGPSSQALNGIMARMHQDMAMTFTGNPDVDFVNGMIPHHQAAVDMAKTELAFGKDPEIRKVAEDVVKEQEAEIAKLQDWLKQHEH